MFNVPSQEEALWNIIWRSLYDCRRNSISGLAQKYYSQRQLNGVGCGQMLHMLRQRGVEWEQQPPAFKYGVLVKKEQYEKVRGRLAPRRQTGTRRRGPIESDNVAL